ncbi:hypothetical protein ACQKO6_00940 [Pseudomonas monteilii]
MSQASILPPPATQGLDEFSLFLTSRSDRVYNNGRQQIEVTLRVVPAADHTFTDEQYASLSLMYKTLDGEWLPLSEDDDQQTWFYRTEQDSRFDYYPSVVDNAVPVELPTYRPGARLKRFYVHSRAAQGESILLVGTMMQSADPSALRTEPLLPELMAEESPHYCFPHDYEWRGNVRVGDRLFEETPLSNHAFIQEYALRPKRVEFSSAPCPQPLHTVQNMIRWDDKHPEYNLATMVSMALPGASTMAYAPALNLTDGLSQRLVRRPLTSTAGQVVVIVQGDHDVPRALQDDHPAQPLRVQAYDRHGALHSLDIDFESLGNRFDLKVQHTPSPHQGVSNIAYFKVQGRGLPTDATQCRLYNNGYQQTYIDVVLEAVDDQGVIVTIPESILNAVTLVDYASCEQLDSSYQVSRSQSARDLRFEYYSPQPSADDTPPSVPQQQSIRFYVSTRARHNRQVAARLVHGGRTYVTCDKFLPAGDGKTSAGRSNCSAIIYPLEQDYHYNHQGDYQLSRYDATDGRASYVQDIDRYHLTLKAQARHRLAYFSRLGSFKWRHVGGSTTHWIYTCGLNGVGQATLSKDRVHQTVNVPNTAVIFHRLIVTLAWPEGSFNRELGILYTVHDEWGNGHNVWITTTDEMDKLRL